MSFHIVVKIDPIQKQDIPYQHRRVLLVDDSCRFELLILLHFDDGCVVEQVDK